MLTDIKLINLLWYTIISLGNYSKYSNYCKGFRKNSNKCDFEEIRKCVYDGGLWQNNIKDICSQNDILLTNVAIGSKQKRQTYDFSVKLLQCCLNNEDILKFQAAVWLKWFTDQRKILPTEKQSPKRYHSNQQTNKYRCISRTLRGRTNKPQWQIQGSVFVLILRLFLCLKTQILRRS